VTRGFRTIRDGVTAFAMLALIWLIAAKLNDQPETVHSGAFHAADGDSLAIGGERMRLKGIDAPELVQSCERNGRPWACGREARDALQRLVAGPPGLSADITATLADAMTKALAAPEVEAWAKKADAGLAPESPEQAAATLKEQIAFYNKWKPYLKAGH